MVKKILLLLSVILTSSPFVLLALFYDSLPNQIPVFMDTAGRPLLTMEKGILSVFRLPLMGVLTQMICYTMSTLKMEVEKERNERMWLFVAVLAALKMSLTSLEILLFSYNTALHFLKAAVWIAIGLAVTGIVVNLYLLYQGSKQTSFAFYLKIASSRKILLAFIFAGYLLLVLFPLLVTMN